MSDFVTVARRQVAQLQTVLSPRVSRIEAVWTLPSATVAMSPDNAEMIAWRFLGTLAAGTAAGETMMLTMSGSGPYLELAVKLPTAFAQASDVFAGDIHSAGGALPTGLLGAGFGLRLARAEARAIGGDLVRDGLNRMVLTLPLADPLAVPEGTAHRTAERARL